MKKQIISLGALAVASSLFTWDNKADAIVTKDYSGKSQVKKESKNSASISDSYYWDIIKNLELQFTAALDLLEDYRYGEKEYEKAKNQLMTRILSEDQYLLEKKIKEYDKYKDLYKEYMSKNPTSKVKRANFDQYNIEDLREKEYNDLLSSIKDAVETFKSDVQKIEYENKELKSYSYEEEKKAASRVDDLANKAYSVYFAFVRDTQHKTEALELKAKVDLVLGDEDKPHRISNKRIENEMLKDLESIIEDFFIETGLNKPGNITSYDSSKHDYKHYREGFEALVKETREAVDKADESWKNKTVKTYGETEIKAHAVKEEKKVEDPQSPKFDNQQEFKTTAGKAEETTQPVAQPLVKIPQGTITGEIVKGPEYPTMENKTLQGEIVQGPDFLTMEQNRPSLSDNYTQPSLTNPILEGLEGSSSKLEIKPQGTESTLKGIQGESSDIEVKPQATETTEASQYGPRPQFNKTPKYVKYRDAGTGIREYNDGTFGYEARPRFNKPSKTNEYNVTTHANGQVSYGARPTQNKPSKTNAYNITTHGNGTVSYGVRPTQNKPSETNAYNVTTHANGQVSYGARPTQNKPSETNAYNVTTHGNGQVSYGARPTYKKPSETNAYNVTTHADGTATYGPRVTK
ncbi:TPA: staphylocoagulase [Staphylococcus aureus]|nr:staphylocoagulase [Staphylococcus aureus]HCW7339270.1 staphylocoagulase [Staphylococcus aureus]HCY9561916.1 staphylocoagulase [Staphylococcus aureus]HDC5308863.1 staphylocoagulase [Staphylococcus aureus]HDC5972102.1 staphylocoagulase [Staphylococcus aureus]